MSGSLRAILRPQRWTLRSGPQGPAGDTGGAGVTSVNGDEGPDVTLDAADVGADPAGTAAGLVAALGNSSTRNVGTTAGTVAAGDDSRFTNARAPTAHASTHASAGSDPLTPAAIGALATAGLGSVTQAWSANLDSYATTAPSVLALSLLGQADAISWRIPLSAPRMRTTNADPAAIDDLDHGYERGAFWLDYVDGQVWISTDSSTGAAVWLPILTSTSATATPTASKIPIANGSSKLDGWISDATALVKGLVLLGAATGAQAYSALLTAIAALGTSGLIARTGAGTVAARTVTGAGIAAVTNGDGVSGNPTVTVPAQPSLVVMRPATLTGYQILNVPAAETAYPEGRFVQVPVDLTNKTEFRILTRNQSAVTAKLRIKASTTGSGGTYSDLASVAAAGDLTLNTGAIATAEGPWTTIAVGLRAPVVLDAYTVGGNTTEDPTLQYIYVEVR